MNAIGKIIFCGEKRTGVSRTTGNQWASQDFVLETNENMMTRRIPFTIFGEERLATYPLQTGDNVNVFFDINGREYNGRWYAEIRAWKIERVGAASQPTAPAAVPPPPTPQPAKPATQSDLPF